MFAHVRQNIISHALLTPGDAVVIAVSGGVDSMVLLEVLTLLAPEFRLKLAVAHFNHRLRGDESDEDERFVRRATEERQLPFFAGAADVAAKARGEGISIEMSARSLRHAFLASSAHKFPAGTIALGHHADDQVETFWLRLLRGDAGPGLGAMQWASPSPANPALRLIRPLLDVSRSDILAFAAERKLQFREDHSNADLLFQRNRLRHEVLPALEKYQPALREITLRMAEILSAEKAYLREQAALADFRSAHPALQREILRQRLLRLQIEPNSALIESLRISEAPVAFAPEQFVHRNASGELNVSRVAQLTFNPDHCVIPVSNPGRCSWNGLEVSWETADRRPAEKGVEYFDAKRLGAEVVLRHWRPGDRFQPIGQAQPAKLQDIFTNLKIPPEERRRRVVATNREGEIFWVEGLRIGERAKVTEQTEQILKWTWHRPATGA